MSHETREIFGDYTGRVEPFGLDEAWLGLGRDSIEQGRKAADEIRKRIWDELGITVSIGVADNKIIAKLGSDLRKPDATTVIAPEDYPRLVWPLPVGDLLYVGRSTETKLMRLGYKTIGDVAKSSPHAMRGLLGKNGELIWTFANGLDKSPVADTGSAPDIKSIGNSATLPRDLVNVEDVQITFWMLAEAVAERLREHRFRARVLQIHVRDNALKCFERQVKLRNPTQLAGEMVQTAMQLFNQNYDFSRQQPIRSLGVRGADLETVDGCIQLSMLAEDRKRINQELIENAIDGIRQRFGHFSVQRGCLFADRIGAISPKDQHVIHPVSYTR
jgi:DNA polymerase-4